MDFTKYSDVALDELISELQKERKERDQKKNEKLIKAFTEAWYAINEAGLDVHLFDGINTYKVDFEDVEIY